MEQDDIFELDAVSTVVLPFYCKRTLRQEPRTSNPRTKLPLVPKLPSEWDVVEIDMLTQEIFIWSPAYNEEAWATIYRQVVSMLRHEYTARMKSSPDSRSFDEVWNPISEDRKKIGVSDPMPIPKPQTNFSGFQDEDTGAGVSDLDDAGFWALEYINFLAIRHQQPRSRFWDHRLYARKRNRLQPLLLCLRRSPKSATQKTTEPPPSPLKPIDVSLPAERVRAELAIRAELAPTERLIGGPKSVIQLLGGDVGRLTQNEWINDEILNSWALLLNNVDRRGCHISSTFLWRRVSERDFATAAVHFINNSKASNSGATPRLILTDLTEPYETTHPQS